MFPLSVSASVNGWRLTRSASPFPLVCFSEWGDLIGLMGYLVTRPSRSPRFNLASAGLS